MLAVLIFSSEALFILDVFRRIKLLSSPHLVLLYSISAQFVFLNAGVLGYADVAGPESLWSFLSNPNLGMWVYFIISIIAYASTLGLRVEYSDVRYRILNMVIHHDHVISYSVKAVVCYTLVHLIFIDFSSLWYHSEYGTTGLRFDGAFFSIFSRLRPLVAMVAILLMNLSFFTNRTGRFWLLAAVSIWQFLIPFTGASRFAVVLVFASGGTVVMFAQRYRVALTLLHAAVGFLVLQASLAGRSGNEFGLVAVPSLVSSMFSLDAHSISYGLFNLFQGVTVTVDSIILDPNVDLVYAWLSISPFPSSVDGFDKVLAGNEVRVSDFVPLSGVAEAYIFGWPIFIIVTTVFFLSLRSTVRVAALGLPLWALVSSIFLAAMFVMANAYPLRNTFRQFLLILAINAFLIAIRRHRENKNIAKRNKASVVFRKGKSVRRREGGAGGW